MGILDLIFPKRCVICKKYGSYLCESCFSFLSFESNSLCLLCKKFSPTGLTHKECLKDYEINGCFTALSYNKIIQRLICSFKNKPFLLDLKNVLAELFYESLIQNENFNNELKKGKWILTSIPLTSVTFRKRGYNQSEILAKELSKRFNLPLLNILKRKEKAFLVKNNADVKNMNIFLVDDEVKTGSTLVNAAKVLKAKGANRVIALAMVKN